MSDNEHYKISSFRFVSGNVKDVTLAYRQLNKGATKKAIIPTCFGGRIGTTTTFAEESLSALAKHHVVVVAMLGNGESSSPSNDSQFPESLDYQDQIHAQHALLQHLGVESLDVVVGFSMAGQQAYYWAAMYPEFVKRSVCICGSARTSPHNYAFLEGPIAALARSSDYADGAYKTKGKAVSGLRGFRRAYMAWLYSQEWYRQEVWKKMTGAETMAEFMDKTQDGMLDWDPEDVLILARQWQKGDVGKVGGGFEKTLQEIKPRMLVMPGKTDQYFPPEDSEIEMRYLKNAELAVIPSIWGHAAGGGGNPEDASWMDEKIADFLASSA